jgi:hypothetical protein
VRWILDAIAVLTLIGLVAAVVMHRRTQSEREGEINATIVDLARLEHEIKYRAVMQGTELNELGWPVTVDAKWFEDEPPRNRMVTPGRPADADLLHPRVRLTVDDDIAGLWYNPFQGIVRARVPVMVSDTDSTTLYNLLNGAALGSLLELEKVKVTGGKSGPGKATGHTQRPPAGEEAQATPSDQAAPQVNADDAPR